ncbi:SSS family solute:Na+ symporter [Ereboglobus sp. PH5-5]|uniref:sodium:solute symporter family protein n=1 Tax=unclassified Ereboglobus TaxID=2626932 RepID=UPI0024059B3C|nr:MULTISPECIES: sodium:solute symporter family protein [unclassified Ereboglobus]MDF9826510.1 SSS family solute:Na+ symporter [Ereboglobus sp. PH5-10]MDF9832700.1 SSS family solute:Na+ symporter [Ereboglobus sp. PH5-5]
MLTNLSSLDLAIIAGFLISVVLVGSAAARRSGRSAGDFFLSGRSMPWWLLGVSMVACTFSCDTPNLVTDIVRTHGVAGNWVWWAFLLTGMLTVFVYAKLWRRSALDTDLGFYEIRYSGRPAAALRGFRALYLGVFFNVMIMATVSLAAIKIGQVLFGLSPVETLLWAMAGVAVYATLGGLTGSIWADFYQYSVAMVGAIFAAVYAVKSPEVGGISSLGELFSNADVSARMAMFPDREGGLSTLMTLLILPVAVQWWNVWYPGSEPGGGGYIAQRMLSAKNEKNAVGATLLFNFLHYAVRPWPWIIVALVSLTQFPLTPPDQQAAARTWLAANPDLVTRYESGDATLGETVRNEVRQARADAAGTGSLAREFPNVDEQFLRHDIAYPGMISKMPKGWLGLIVASLIAAYMSTIATHLNWGSSYVVQDFYTRFIRKDVSPRHAVFVGRLTMLALLALSGVVALWMQNAKDSFDILLQIGAGTGLLYILRWFWWRINAWSEITAMIVSFAVACFFQWGAPHLGIEAAMRESGWFSIMDYSAWKLVLGILLTTAGWLVVTFLTQPEPQEVLAKFCEKIRAGGPGWRKVSAAMPASSVAKGKWDVPTGLLCMMVGCLAVWSALFGIGNLLYGRSTLGTVLCVVAVLATLATLRLSTRIKLG